jgi:hypothetical protein
LLLSSFTSLSVEIEPEPGVLVITGLIEEVDTERAKAEAGLTAEPALGVAIGAGFVAGVFFAASVTAARGRVAVAVDLVDSAFGDAEGRPDTEADRAALAGTDAVAFVGTIEARRVVVGAVVAGAFAAGMLGFEAVEEAVDVRVAAALAGLAAAAVEAVLGAAAVDGGGDVTLFLRAAVADVAFNDVPEAATPVLLTVGGEALAEPEPKVPEFRIYNRHIRLGMHICEQLRDIVYLLHQGSRRSTFGALGYLGVHRLEWSLHGLRLERWGLSFNLGLGGVSSLVIERRLFFADHCDIGVLRHLLRMRWTCRRLLLVTLQAGRLRLEDVSISIRTA